MVCSIVTINLLPEQLDGSQLEVPTLLTYVQLCLYGEKLATRQHVPVAIGSGRKTLGPAP